MFKNQLRSLGNIEVRSGFLESVDFLKVLQRILCIYFLSLAIRDSFLHVSLLGTGLSNGKPLVLGKELLPTPTPISSPGCKLFVGLAMMTIKGRVSYAVMTCGSGTT
jgi:hypothetical protein